MSNIQKTKDNVIFSKNLRKYIELNEKSQVDVCKDFFTPRIKTPAKNFWLSLACFLFWKGVFYGW